MMPLGSLAIAVNVNRVGQVRKPTLVENLDDEVSLRTQRIARHWVGEGVGHPSGTRDQLLEAEAAACVSLVPLKADRVKAGAGRQGRRAVPVNYLDRRRRGHRDLRDDHAIVHHRN